MVYQDFFVIVQKKYLIEFIFSTKNQFIIFIHYLNMEVLKKISEELFGNEFKVEIYPNAISITAKDKLRAFCFGLMNYPGSFRVREKVWAFKRFEEVEKILQPLMEKYDVYEEDFELAVYGVDFNGTIKQGTLISDIPGIDSSFIDNYTHIDKEDEPQIRYVLTQFQKAIDFHEQTFINKYPTLQQAYEALAGMNTGERSEFYRAPNALRELIFESLCNASGDLDNLFEITIRDYREIEKELPETFKDHDNIAIDLQHYFKSKKA